MTDLKLSAELLECYIVSNNQDRFALFDIETGKQCSNFYNLDQWPGINVASELLGYIQANY